ncbi:MAG: 2-succinyl-6-hydroxy-2,4-cyclohexadiene-1-carboxylate synthase [Anaerolineales bacterium]|nr:2-succinyl-6-hydroxy-2,4-cyclohexadiene-1-carboxylate synthase [Anaerolineales bacterium]
MANLLTLGSPKNPPLVFLHGFLGSGKNWRDINVTPRNATFMSHFTEKYFCILPDLIGHGENTNFDINSPLNFDILTNWFFQLLDEIHAPKIHLVGYSLGGRAALAFACRYPERILSLTLESASPGIIDPNQRARRLEEDSARAEAILKNGISAFVEAWYQMPLFASLESHPQLLSARKESAKRNDPRWMAKIIRELSPALQTPLWDSLPKLSFPVLLIAGAKDEKYVQVIQKMSERMPAAQKNIVPEAGHNVHMEEPEKYISLLNEFLSNRQSNDFTTKLSD